MITRSILSACLVALTAASVFGQSAGTIDTVAGSGSTGLTPDGGLAVNASLGSAGNHRLTVVTDNKGNFYIGDVGNARVRKVDAHGIITTVAGGGTAVANGVPALQAYIAPDSVAFDGAGNMIIASGNEIFKVDTSGTVTTVAGGPTNGLSYSGDGPAIQAGFLAVDAAADRAGNIYISDSTDNRILKVDISTGMLTSFAGNGKSGYAGDGGLAKDATLTLPQGLSVDLQGNVYFCDTATGHVRKVAANGVISTVAGNGSSIFIPQLNNGQLATEVGMTPVWVTVDSAGDLFIVDGGENHVLKVDTSGIINLFAGSPLPGLPFGGDKGPANQADLFMPTDAAVDNLGNVFIADSGNSRIREVYSGQTQPGAGSPSFTAAGVVNGASFATGGVVPGAISTIFGSNLTSHTGINLTSGLPLPTEFLGVSVKVNGTPAALFAVDNVNGQEQINFQVPWDVKGTASIEVTNGTATSAPVNVPVLGAQPGIINYSSGGQTFGAILHANFQLADTGHPAKPGETVLIYCTGLGAVNSPPGDGAASNGQTTIAKPVVAIGGNVAPVSFSGLAPGFVGLYQVNAEVPTSVASGNARVSMVIAGGGNSNIVLLPVQ